MKRKVFILLLFFLQQVQAQSIAGEWTGILAHKSCMGSRLTLAVKLFLTPSGSNWGGTIHYYSNTGDIRDSTAFATWDFRFRARLNNQELYINYSARDELYGRRTNAGFYIQGGYSILLAYSKNEVSGKERLTGYYAGANGGHGDIYFQRAVDVLAVTPEASGSILSRLRNRIAERKKPPQDSLLLAALQPPPGTAMPDSSLFASLVPEPVADSALLQTLNKKNSRRLDTTTVLNLVKASYVDIQVYDNATEDGDTISILADSQLVAHRIRVGVKPVTIRLLRPGDRSSTRLVMVAENLGSIPPNTAYLVFEADDKTRHTINLSSSFSQSGSIVIKWK